MGRAPDCCLGRTREGVGSMRSGHRQKNGVRWGVRSQTQWLAICGQVAKTGLARRSAGRTGQRGPGRAYGEGGRKWASDCPILSGQEISGHGQAHAEKKFSRVGNSMSACLSCPTARKCLKNRDIQRTSLRTRNVNLGKKGPFCVRLRNLNRTQTGPKPPTGVVSCPCRVRWWLPRGTSAFRLGF